MLLEMYIENFLLIEKLNISLSEKLNIFTGETGAGKSMIFGALNVGLGQKINGDCVRANSKKTLIQLVFYISSDFVINKLIEYGIELENGSLIITREVYTSGRTVIRLNDRIVTLSILREITSNLIDIHGQHAHQSLLYPKNHLELLDLMGSSSFNKLKEKVKKCYNEVRKIKNSIKELSNENLSNTDPSYLQFQIDEIEALNISKDDENSLEEKYNLYKNIETIIKTVQNTLQIVSGDHEDEGIKEKSYLAVKNIENVVSFDDKLLNILEILNSISFQLDDVSSELRVYIENIDVDEQEMFEVEQRMNSINELKLKHGNSIQLILEKKEFLKNQLNIITSKDSLLKSLNFELLKKEEEYLSYATLLSQDRRILSKKFISDVSDQLMMLNMSNCKFEVSFRELDDASIKYSSNGIDSVEFLISTNPGMALKPLAKIASGGEISRVMLAIKIAVSDVDQTGTLVFDEVDTGISGVTAVVVGEKLQEISNRYQIICITHLPQIAVMADSHFLINKTVENAFANTTVVKLGQQRRYSEVARMLSGDQESNISIENAQEMIENALRYKHKLHLLKGKMNEKLNKSCNY